MAPKGSHPATIYAPADIADLRFSKSRTATNPAATWVASATTAIAAKPVRVWPSWWTTSRRSNNATTTVKAAIAMGTSEPAVRTTAKARTSETTMARLSGRQARSPDTRFPLPANNRRANLGHEP